MSKIPLPKVPPFFAGIYAGLLAAAGPGIFRGNLPLLCRKTSEHAAKPNIIPVFMGHRPGHFRERNAAIPSSLSGGLS